MTIKGYPDEKMTAREGAQKFATVGRLTPDQVGVDVRAATFYQVIATDAAEAASTTTVIVATAHSAIAGDIISWTGGALITREYRVLSVTTNAITVEHPMAAAPGAGDAFKVLRLKAPVAGSDGSTVVSGTVTTGAIESPTGSFQQLGKLGFAAVGATYTTIMTLTVTASILQIFNTLDATVVLSINNGVTDCFELEPGDSTSLDLSASAMVIASGAVIRVKRLAGAPTSGTIRVTAIGKS